MFLWCNEHNPEWLFNVIFCYTGACSYKQDGGMCYKLCFGSPRLRYLIISTCTPLSRPTGVPAGERTVADAKSMSFRSDTGYDDGITEVFNRLSKSLSTTMASIWSFAVRTSFQDTKKQVSVSILNIHRVALYVWMQCNGVFVDI